LVDNVNWLQCTPGGGTCISWAVMSTRTSCTDYSIALHVSSGEYYETETFSIGISFTMYGYSNAWFAMLVVGVNSAWYDSNRVNTALRSSGYLNTSPTAVTLTIIYKGINIQHDHVVQTSDSDETDILSY
ncbi:unnamed protein product, partial [Adineta ricciae]